MAYDVNVLKRATARLEQAKTQRADAAAKLNPEIRPREDLPYGLEIRRAAVSRTLKVNEVQPFRAVTGEAPCHRSGIVAVDRHLRVVAAHQPHRLAADHIYCRK